LQRYPGFDQLHSALQSELENAQADLTAGSISYVDSLQGFTDRFRTWASDPRVINAAEPGGPINAALEILGGIALSAFGGYMVYVVATPKKKSRPNP
jgi:hypothetical protein